MATTLLLALACVAACSAHERLADIAATINSDPTTTWTASAYRFLRVPEHVLTSMMGARMDAEADRLRGEFRNVTDVRADVPDSFDARTQWANCPSVSDVRDQSACGSCWAVAAAEVMSDRYCIQYGIKVNISANDLMSCCRICGNGCGGGYPIMAFRYWETSGIVTGGVYGSKSGCQPYVLAQCEHHIPAGHYPVCPKAEDHTPKCVKECEAGYPVSYEEDKKNHRGMDAYNVHGGVEGIQTEIMKNGPVEAAFTVYEDFLTYKSGVYQHKTGKMLGGHAVRVLGWGVEDGTPYWIVANSWNSDWGDNGYFKMIRGTNNCGFEGGMVAGKAKKPESLRGE